MKHNLRKEPNQVWMIHADWHGQGSEAQPADGDDPDVEVIADEEEEYMQETMYGPQTKPAAKKMPKPPSTPPPGHVIAQQMAAGPDENQETQQTGRPITAFSEVMSRLGRSNKTK